MNWRVLEDENANDHRFIEFRIESQGSRAHRLSVNSSDGRGWIIVNIDPDLLSIGLLQAKWTAKGNTADEGPEDAAAELLKGIT